MRNDPISCCCLICNQQICSEFYTEHLFCHLGCNAFKCGYVDCCADFSSPVQLKLHNKAKHAKVEKGLSYLISSKLVDSAISPLLSPSQLEYRRFFKNLASSEGKKISKDLFKIEMSSVCQPMLKQSTDKILEMQHHREKNRKPKQKEKFVINYKRWCLNCSKCGLVISDTSFKRKEHCIAHLKKTGGIKDSYRCLKCQQWFDTVTRVSSHLKLKHNITWSESKPHYLDCSETYKDTISIMDNECFDSATRFRKSESYQQDKNSCQKCFKHIRNNITDQEQHAISHLGKEDRVKCLLECLLCPKDRRFPHLLYKRGLIRHFNQFHVKVKPKEGSNYINRKREHLQDIGEMIENCFSEEMKLKYIKLKMRSYGISSVNDQRPESAKSGELICLSKCLKCGESVANTAVAQYRHGALHVESKNKRNGPYKCLLCTDKSKSSLTDYYFMRKHIVKEHSVKLDKIRVNVHYLNNSSQVEKFIKSEIA